MVHGDALRGRSLVYACSLRKGVVPACAGLQRCRLDRSRALSPGVTLGTVPPDAGLTLARPSNREPRLLKPLWACAMHTMSMLLGCCHDWPRSRRLRESALATVFGFPLRLDDKACSLSPPSSLFFYGRFLYLLVVVACCL